MHAAEVFWTPPLRPPDAAGTLDPAGSAVRNCRLNESAGGTVDYEPDRGPVDRIDVATGGAIFLASGTPPTPEDLPLYLSKTVAAWLKQTPSLTVRATLPIVANGNTIAVHVWFE